jgi:hypothetical protein
MTMIPLTLSIELKEVSEAFSVDAEHLAVQPPPVVEVVAEVLDTEAQVVRAYQLHSMVDVAKQTSHKVGTLFVSSVEHNRKHLEQLRNHLDLILGDVERDGDRTKIYGEVVDENRDERGHYAVIRPSELP